MSVTITPEQHQEIQALPPEEQAAAMAAYAALTSKEGAEIPPDVRKQLFAEAMEIANSNTAGEDIRQLAELEMIAPSRTLGRFECRPISMGVIQILERIKHPLFGGGKGDPTMGDMVSMFYCLCEEDLGKLVQESMDGTLEAGANVWAFELGMLELEQMTEQLQPMLNAAEGVQKGPPKKQRKRRARSA